MYRFFEKLTGRRLSGADSGPEDTDKQQNHQQQQQPTNQTSESLQECDTKAVQDILEEVEQNVCCLEHRRTSCSCNTNSDKQNQSGLAKLLGSFRFTRSPRTTARDSNRTIQEGDPSLHPGNTRRSISSNVVKESPAEGGPSCLSVEELRQQIDDLLDGVKHMTGRTRSLAEDMDKMNRKLNGLEDEIKECVLLNDLIEKLQRDGEVDNYCELMRGSALKVRV